MKTLLIGFLFLGVFFVSGCTTSNKLSTNELFEKKQECEKYKESLQKEIDKETKAFENMWNFYSENIEEIFYSESKNSCFAIIDWRYIIKNDGGKSEYKKIVDILSNELSNYNKLEHKNMTYYNEKIKSLKWEE